MTHIVAGYPSLRESKAIANAMLEIPVEYLEIQIPFSDPIGDGPTITTACRTSIEKGTKVSQCFDLMESLPKTSPTKLLFMTYYNILFQYGVKEFCKKAKQVGAWGLIVPDIPFDEEPFDHFIQIAKNNGLVPIQLISPITPKKRLERIGEITEGFVYCVAGFGTTGTKQKRLEDLGDYLKRIREHVQVSLAVGFGIDSQEAIHEVGAQADIVVIGSKIIQLYEETKNTEDIKQFLKSP